MHFLQGKVGYTDSTRGSKGPGFFRKRLNVEYLTRIRRTGFFL